MTAAEVCAAANQAEQTKIEKYSYITSHAYHSFTPVAFEIVGMSFLYLGHRIANTTGDKSFLAYLMQRFSVAIHRDPLCYTPPFKDVVSGSVFSECYRIVTSCMNTVVKKTLA